MNLLSLVFNAPLIACRPRDPNTFHAVTMEDVVDGWKAHEDHPRRVFWFRSACGTEKVRLIGQAGVPALWPPYKPTAPWVRCLECHQITGRMRPRVRFVPEELSK